MRLTGVIPGVLLLGAAVLAIAPQVSAFMREDVIEGNPASPVRVFIYEDLQCGDCAKFRTMLDERLLPKYGARVCFIHRDFPLAKHEWARPAAVAARWVYGQSSALGFALRREILSEHDNITAQTLRPWLAEFAKRNGLDPNGILASIDDNRLGAVVDQERQAAAARGVTRVPAVFIGGQSFVETIVYEDVARALDEALR